MTSRAARSWCIATITLVLVTVLQLAAGAVLDLAQFEGKAFGTRLLTYPVGMLALPAGWWLVSRVRGVHSVVPWDAAALIAWAFFVDVTGNTLDLYDTIDWWDNLNHFANWITLSLGAGLCIARADVRPRWVLVVVTTGVGALLAIAWEIAEWYTFIRHGTELDGAYEDTLSDEVLGSLGALVAGVLLLWIVRRRATSAPA